MSVSLIHPSLNRVGGAEKICLEMMRILKETGRSVTLYTLDEPQWGRIESNWGVKDRPDAEHHLQEETLSPSTALQWLRCSVLYLWLLYRAQMGESLTVNNYGEVYPFISDVSVVHSQPLVAVEGNPYQVPLWDLGQRLYRAVFNSLAERRLSPLLIANSFYNARQVHGLLGVEPRVIHPFIDPVQYRFEPKTGQVLTVCRITPGKNLHVIPEVLQHLRGVRACLAGRTTTQSPDVLRYLQGPNVDIYPNPKRDEVMGLMRRASVYLSTQRNEAFGMAVLEAMSAGCVPVVYRDGGPWHDILEARDGEAGFGYTTAEEAAARIDAVLSDEALRERLRENALARARGFTRERFRTDLLQVLEEAQHRRVDEGLLVDAHRLAARVRGWFGRLW